MVSALWIVQSGAGVSSEMNHSRIRDVARRGRNRPKIPRARRSGYSSRRGCLKSGEPGGRLVSGSRRILARLEFQVRGERERFSKIIELQHRATIAGSRKLLRKLRRFIDVIVRGHRSRFAWSNLGYTDSPLLSSRPSRAAPF